MATFRKRWPQGILEPRLIPLYPALMMRFFDMDDHARLPWRFTRDTRSVLARA
ncbi:hypothetical protein NX862_10795 [Rhodobacter sp. KR11]|uniref:hypothetical protein n=1 Tax=Rhodobacter sp. KR11 TaxID=2974588 RepID=UPI0022230D3E|nr:hypothetical protein [Rhodobacter sp. KR11]MCW1919246.1 hypothetical protein [Rhodobacter sp. KR11]